MLPSVQLYVVVQLLAATHCRHGETRGACGKCRRHSEAIHQAAEQIRRERRAAK